MFGKRLEICKRSIVFAQYFCVGSSLVGLLLLVVKYKGATVCAFPKRAF